ncbi:p-loop containing nucleoside triphosphate hydrolase protein [Phaffia rhodozyma]|uniref:RNA helicase n=1 Tax=Phaffia rhodozyma TaxID=264483 RepID=A0A0F7STY9_PHARH|nr:p-loop containing nucleoside triphosphate hydrolase protein [Phaffia rhodozyma]
MPRLPPSQLPPPSPLRTHVSYTSTSSDSFNATTPNISTPEPSSPRTEWKPSHKATLSASSTSSNTSSSNPSANGGLGATSSGARGTGAASRPSSPGGTGLNGQAGTTPGIAKEINNKTPAASVVIPCSGRATPGIGGIAYGAVWGANGNGQNDVWGVSGGSRVGGWEGIIGEGGALPLPSPGVGLGVQQDIHVDNELDKLLRDSPLIKNLTQRITQTEASVLSLSGQLVNLNTSLTSLLPNRPTSSNSSTSQSYSVHSNSVQANASRSPVPPGLSLPSNSGTADINGNNNSVRDRQTEMSPDAIRLLASQVMTLSTSVSQLQALVALQQQTSKGTTVTPQMDLPSPMPNQYRREQVPFNLTLPDSKTVTPTGGPTPALTSGVSSPSAHHTPSPFFVAPGMTGGTAAPLSPAFPLPSPGGGPGTPAGMSLAAATQWINAPGSRPGSALSGRPDMARSFSSPYTGTSGGVGTNTGDKPPTPGATGLRRPVINLSRVDSYETSNESGWPAPPPGPVTPGGSNMGPGTAHNVTKWDQVGLVPELLRAVLKYGIGPPNKVQQRALPFLLRGADIIAQAPPTQERIIAYVVPGINACLSHPVSGPYKGPQVVIITTTVDQATQAYKLVRDLATPLGLRSSLCVGSSSANNSNGGWIDEQRMLAPSIVVGTPAKISELFTSSRALSGELVRFLVIDEVDQLIARNLYEFVIEVVKKLPLPRSRGLAGAVPGGGALMSPSILSPYDTGASSPFNPASSTQFPGTSRRFPGNNPAGAIGSVHMPGPVEGVNNNGVERQTCLFSNTVPQDVLNFSNAIQVREPVRVLVRRDGGGGGGGGGGGQGASSITSANIDLATSSVGGAAAGGLKHLYLYLAFTTHGPSRASAETGAIGSGRATGTGSEANQAKEWKLDALADLLDDETILPAIVFVGSEAAMDSVVYKLSNRGVEALFLHPDMGTQARSALLTKFRNPSTNGRSKVLVIFDLTVKASDVGVVRLVINYDLPRSVEGYAQRVSPAQTISHSRPGVVVNLIQANGGDVEMLRSIECAYKFKCSEVPVNLREVF